MNQSIEILFENENFLIVNKPIGLVVHTTLDKSRENLFDLVQAERKGDYLSLAHRLDRDTSGAILFTKNERLNEFVQAGFGNHSIVKKYWVIVHGNWNLAEESIVEDFLKKGKNAKKHEIMEVVKRGGVKAKSHVKIIKSTKEYSLLEFTLLTGRMHQIRVQCASRGFPIVGDVVYGKVDHAPRLFLHSRKLEFDFENKKIKAEAPIDSIFTNWIEKIK